MYWIIPRAFIKILFGCIINAYTETESEKKWKWKISKRMRKFINHCSCYQRQQKKKSIHVQLGNEMLIIAMIIFFCCIWPLYSLFYCVYVCGWLGGWYWLCLNKVCRTSITKFSLSVRKKEWNVIFF